MPPSPTWAEAVPVQKALILAVLPAKEATKARIQISKRGKMQNGQMLLKKPQPRPKTIPALGRDVSTETEYLCRMRSRSRGYHPRFLNQLF